MTSSGGSGNGPLLNLGIIGLGMYGYTAFISSTEVAASTAARIPSRTPSGSAGKRSMTSALSIFNFRVQRGQFGAGVINGELPFDAALFRVGGGGPRFGLFAKQLDVLDSTSF